MTKGVRENSVLPENAGMTLLEVTAAVSILIVALGMAAQSVFNFKVNMIMEEEKTQATARSQSILNILREEKLSYGIEPDETQKKFPEEFIEFITQVNTVGWPLPGISENAAGSPGADFSEYRKLAALQEVKTVVELYDAADGGDVGNDSTLIEVHAVTTWTSATGRELSTRLITLMGDE